MAAALDYFFLHLWLFALSLFFTVMIFHSIKNATDKLLFLKFKKTNKKLNLFSIVNLKNSKNFEAYYFLIVEIFYSIFILIIKYVYNCSLLTIWFFGYKCKRFWYVSLEILELCLTQYELKHERDRKKIYLKKTLPDYIKIFQRFLKIFIQIVRELVTTAFRNDRWLIYINKKSKFFWNKIILKYKFEYDFINEKIKRWINIYYPVAALSRIRILWSKWGAISNKLLCDFILFIKKSKNEWLGTIADYYLNVKIFEWFYLIKIFWFIHKILFKNFIYYFKIVIHYFIPILFGIFYFFRVILLKNFFIFISAVAFISNYIKYIFINDNIYFRKLRSWIRDSGSETQSISSQLISVVAENKLSDVSYNHFELMKLQFIFIVFTFKNLIKILYKPFSKSEAIAEIKFFSSKLNNRSSTIVNFKEFTSFIFLANYFINLTKIHKLTHLTKKYNYNDFKYDAIKFLFNEIELIYENEKNINLIKYNFFNYYDFNKIIVYNNDLAHILCLYIHLKISKNIKLKVLFFSYEYPLLYRFAVGFTKIFVKFEKWVRSIISLCMHVDCRMMRYIYN